MHAIDKLLIFKLQSTPFNIILFSAQYHKKPLKQREILQQIIS